MDNHLRIGAAATATALFAGYKLYKETRDQNQTANSQSQLILHKNQSNSSKTQPQFILDVNQSNEVQPQSHPFQIDSRHQFPKESKIYVVNSIEECRYAMKLLKSYVIIRWFFRIFVVVFSC